LRAIFPSFFGRSGVAFDFNLLITFVCYSVAFRDVFTQECLAWLAVQRGLAFAFGCLVLASSAGIYGIAESYIMGLLANKDGKRWAGLRVLRNLYPLNTLPKNYFF
jgi:hypothetical protein